MCLLLTQALSACLLPNSCLGKSTGCITGGSRTTPNVVLSLMYCSCMHVCKALQCKCIANRLHITEMCRLTSYSNVQPNEDPDTVVDNGDDFDNESDGKDKKY